MSLVNLVSLMNMVSLVNLLSLVNLAVLVNLAILLNLVSLVSWQMGQRGGHWIVAVICYQKICGLYGLEHYMDKK